MKKIFFTIAVALFAFGAMAQESSKTNDKYIILQETKIFKELKNKSALLFQFTYNPEKTEKGDLDKGYYQYTATKKPDGNIEITLINTENKKIIDSYRQKPNTIPPKPLSCEQQAQAQWASFNTNVYPQLLATANRLCFPIRYCLQIFCNERPTVAYMLLIRPTNPMCRVATPVSVVQHAHKF